MNVRRLLLVACVVLFHGTLLAQSFSTLRDTGPRATRINCVFVAEGYTAAEQTKFQTDAAAKLAVLLRDESFLPFADVVNAYAISVASNESGADDPLAGTVRDTYFNSTFNTSGIDRLLTINSAGQNRLLVLLTQFVPDYDIVIVLVNSTKYGGAGGFPTVTSLNSSSDEVVLHELGHSFAALTDEYVDAAAAPNYPPREYANATQITDPGSIPWRDFIQPTTALPTASAADENTVGLFLGSHFRATGFYRPTFNNKMRVLNRPFGSVNLRAFGAAVHRLRLNSATVAPTITAQPAGAAVALGQPYTLAVAASGLGPFTYQWRFKSLYVVGATSPTLTISSMSAAAVGAYAVEVTNSAGTTTSATASLALPAAPAIASLSPSASVNNGSSTTLSVTASGGGPYSYQWRKDGTAIPGATNSTLALTAVGSSAAGSYTVVVTNAGGSVTSSAVVIAVPTSSRLSNLSVRTTLAAGRTLIVGAVATGARPILVRGVGPTLVNFGVTGAMPDPRLELYRDGSLLESNAGWNNSPALSAVFAAAGAFPLGTSGRDAALVRSLDASISVQLKTTAGGTVLVELYDTGTTVSPRLTNVSARNQVGTGDNILIVGFYLSGAGTKRLLVRAAGPALASFGVSGTLADPRLDLYVDGNGTPLASNDDWSIGLKATMQSVAPGFPFADGSRDSALEVTLAAERLYSVQVRGAGTQTGEALVELYELP